MSKRKKTSFIVTDPSGSLRKITLVGRFAQTLKALITSGDGGVTALDLGGPAIRLSHYIFVLKRKHGLMIDMEREKHSGDFAGWHGLYKIRSTVRTLDQIGNVA